ncbi:pre-peptidase C-terminal domain-containing protein [Pontiellaceae bacterium B12219]|nr:pre-peptidase C-terminal domain-containing protein [Pontiellaceae bacterium B12219]
MDTSSWPYSSVWSTSFIEADSAAGQLSDAEAVTAYLNLIDTFAMNDRLKSEILTKASRCAQREGDFTTAMELAERIPEECLSIHRQMELLLEQEAYAELLNRFTDEAMERRSFHLSYAYPELEDIMGDLLYYRSLAYAHTGDLSAAEADLKVMNDKRSQLDYSSGEAIHDEAWLRLGNFYRTFLIDDDQALSAYLKVCSRTTPDNEPKPVSTGASDTIIQATEAAASILRARGKEGEALELEERLAEAQTQAAEAGLGISAFSGAGQTLTWPENSIQLHGVVTYNGQLELPTSIETSWSLVSNTGTGTVVFADATALTTEAAFTAPGYYTIRLTATDGTLSHTHDSLITVNPSSGLLDDELEENDDPAQARTVAAGHYDRLQAHDAADWYQVVLPVDSTLTIHLTFEHSEGDLELFLYQSDGTSVIEKSETGNNNETIVQALSAGTYLFNVFPYMGEANYTSYAMDISIEPEPDPLDTDGDGLLDAWEIRYFGQLSADNGGPSEDWDGDGMNNRDEYYAGTNPIDALSIFRIVEMQTVSKEALKLSWNSESNKTYHVWSASGIGQEFLPTLYTNIPATPPLNTITTDVTQVQGFYKIYAE